MNKDDFPEIGFTPSNFNSLIELSGLRGKQFYDKFEVGRTSYFEWKRGAKGPNYKRWKKLLDDVDLHLNTK